MRTPVRDPHHPDPKCCGCGLRPRSRGNDLLRLTAVVLLLLLPVLLLSGCTLPG